MSNKKYLLILLLVFALIFGGLYIEKSSALYSRLSGYINKNKVIAIVGSEQIFEKDLESELSYAPPVQSVDKNIYLEKIIDDSIVLQTVADKKLITLDKSYFNNPEKDYKKRLEIVETSRSILTNSENRIKGRAIVIWFYNNNHIGPMGYEAAKNIASEKIETVFERVISNQITLDEAVQEIRGDSSLALIDPVYKTNAVLDFNETSKKKITFDEYYNKLIWETDEGEYTPITLLSTSEVPENTTTGVAYSFAYVEQKNVDGLDVELSEYIQNRKSEIGVKYF